MTCILFSCWYHSLQKWLRIFHLLLLMLILFKIHHHSAEISFLTMPFPFWPSLWLSWIIPNTSPYLFVQVFLSFYPSCQKNEFFFFCINLFSVLPDCSLHFISDPCQPSSEYVLFCQLWDYLSSRTTILHFLGFFVLFSEFIQNILFKKIIYIALLVFQIKYLIVQCCLYNQMS